MARGGRIPRDLLCDDVLHHRRWCPNFRQLWEEGIGRLALVYVFCLFGFIIWIGLAISWIFFHGVKPPLQG